jgi:hypothetical protein
MRKKSPEGYRKGSPSFNDARRLLEIGSVLGPNVVAIVGIVASTSYAAAQGANGYLAYGFAAISLLAYVGLTKRKLS